MQCYCRRSACQPAGFEAYSKRRLDNKLAQVFVMITVQSLMALEVDVEVEVEEAGGGRDFESSGSRF